MFDVNKYLGEAVVVVWSDSVSESPRDWDCNVGIIYATEGSGIADIVIRGEDDMLADDQYDKRGVTLPIYMYRHSGTDIKTDGSPFRYWQHAGWDSGQCGFIHCSLDNLRAVYGDDMDRWTEGRREMARVELVQEIETLAQWLRGEVMALEYWKWDDENKEYYWVDSVGAIYPETSFSDNGLGMMIQAYFDLDSPVILFE